MGNFDRGASVVHRTRETREGIEDTRCDRGAFRRAALVVGLVESGYTWPCTAVAAEHAPHACSTATVLLDLYGLASCAAWTRTSL
jgi:hypothetical protein